MAQVNKPGGKCCFKTNIYSFEATSKDDKSF